jgi:cytochrome P450
MKYRTLIIINYILVIDKLTFWKKDILDQIIDDRRCDRSSSLFSNNDLIDLLLLALDNNGKSFTNREIKDEPLSFVFSGHETTVTLMTNTSMS